MIAIDVDAGTLVVEIDDRELAERLVGWQPPAPRYDFGVFARYRALVSSASDGAVLVPPRVKDVRGRATYSRLRDL